MSWEKTACPTTRAMRSGATFWYRRSREPETFSSITRSYVPGTRLRENPPFESVEVVALTAPFPTAVARIVTGRFTRAAPFNRTVPWTETGVGLRAIGRIPVRAAGDDAGIDRAVYPGALAEPA